MKIIAVAQGASLRIILKLSEIIRDKIPHELSVIVSNSSEYMDALHDDALYQRLDSIPLIKEWEMFEASAEYDGSEKETTYWEDIIDEPLMWSLFADKYLTQGTYHTVRQDYCRYFDDDRLIKVITYGYKTIDEFFYQQSPDLVLTTGVTSYCEYIAQKIAKKHAVPFALLDSSTISGNIQLLETCAEWPSSTWQAFKKSTHLLNCDTLPLECIERAQSYVSRIQEKGFSREYKDYALLSHKFDWLKAFNGLYQGLVKSLDKGRDPIIAGDQYVSGYFRAAWYKEILQPWRSWRISEYLKERYVDPENIPGGHRRIFYPLYFEPEASTQAYGYLHQNQIETIKQLAMASPADCEILVKEHPKANGLRPVSYYKKLLQIPGVRLLPPNMSSNDAIALCNAVAVVAGAIGFEAAILGKPVVVLGQPPYRHMGKPHFYVCTNLRKLHKVIEQILDPVTSDKIRRAGEEVFVRLLSIVLLDSCPADLEALFINNKQNQPSNMFGEKITRSQQQEALITYLANKFSIMVDQEASNKVA